MQVDVEISTNELNLYGVPPTVSGGGGGAVDSVNGETGVVVLNQDEILDGTTYKQYSQTEKTKLAGIATAATANSADATLLARANHTGSQTASTISDFNTSADARIALATFGRFARPFRSAINDYFLTTIGLGTAYSSTAVSSSTTNSNNRGKLTPVYIGTAVTIDTLALYMVTANAGASAVVRLGIYDDLDGRPNNVIVDAGTASVNGAAAMKTLSFTPVTLQPGFYWAIAATQNLDTSGVNPTFASVTGTQAIGDSVPAANNNMFPIATVAASGALTAAPAVSLLRSISASCFHIWVKRSA